MDYPDKFKLENKLVKVCIFLYRYLTALPIATLQSTFWAQLQQDFMHKAEFVNAEIKLQLNNKHLVSCRDTPHERNVTNLADTNVWRKTFQQNVLKHTKCVQQARLSKAIQAYPEGGKIRKVKKKTKKNQVS